MTGAREVAGRILASMKRMATQPETYVPVRESEFTHLDLSSYRDFREHLEKHGYRYLGDYELLEVTNAPESLLQRTMIRTMVSRDATIVGYHYQVKTRKARLIRNALVGILNLRIIAAPRLMLQFWSTKSSFGFDSELGETFFVTHNNFGLTLSSPTSVDVQVLPREAPLEAVREAHEQRVSTARILASASPTIMSTYADVRAMGQRLKRRKDAHRMASKWITRAELLTHSNGNEELADEILEAVQQILAEESAG